MDAQGGVLVGTGIRNVNDALFRPFRWDVIQGLTFYPVPRGFAAYVTTLSPDAEMAAGFAVEDTPDGVSTAVRWDAAGQLTTLATPVGRLGCEPAAISDDSRIIAGTCFQRVFVDNGYRDVPDLVRWVGDAVDVPEPLSNADGSTAEDASADGETIVGKIEVQGPLERRAMVWRAESGKRLLEDILRDAGIGDALSGWVLHEIVGVSDDGLVVAGNGVAPDGERAAFYAILPRGGR
ncbi:MAG TPA: hypothetical protein VFC51_12140 [Chloroflexota bacterium]|nr:hypothetical protein [Chloroflexota bacterium]